MNIIDICAISIVLLASYVIALLSSKASKSPRVETYLFAGNSLLLSASSSIGAILSIPITFTALISGGFMYGWQIIFSFWIGIGLAVLFLRRLSRTNGHAEFCANKEEREGSAGVSFLSRLCEKHGLNGHVVPYVFSIFLYGCLLAMEFSVARSTINYLSEIDAFNLAAIIILIASVTYSYVYIGGYKAVLYTDYFQLMVIAVFVGLCFGSLLFNSDVKIQHFGPLVSKLAWTSKSDMFLLHVSVVFGGFSFLVASIDQWNRTFGTLKKDAVSSVYWSSTALAIFAPIPVLIGAYAFNVHGTEFMKDATNNASLLILKSYLQTVPLSTRFLFIMSLTCVILTTINTYLITLCQLYYELTIRLHATVAKTYIFEYLFKWREIRLVVLVIMFACISVSYNVSDDSVYFFGVATLAGFSFFLPFVIKLITDDYYIPTTKLSLSSSMIIGLTIWPAITWLLSVFVGAAVNDRLYLLSVGALVSVVTANFEYIYKFVKGYKKCQ